MVCHYVGSFRAEVCASKPDATLPHLYKSTMSWLWCSIWPQTYRPAVIHGSLSYVTLKMFIYEQLCLHAVQDKIYCSSIGLFHNDDFKLFFIQIPTCIKLWTPPSVANTVQWCCVPATVLDWLAQAAPHHSAHPRGKCSPPCWETHASVVEPPRFWS